MANILVVDDDRNIRRTLAASLESASHQVTVAESAEHALELLGPSAPAVVVSDVRMAGMSGLKLLEALKRLNPTMPVVMMTAFGSIPDSPVLNLMESGPRKTDWTLGQSGKPGLRKNRVVQAEADKSIREKSTGNLTESVLYLRDMALHDEENAHEESPI